MTPRLLALIVTVASQRWPTPWQHGRSCLYLPPSGASWPPINDRRDRNTAMFRLCPAAALSPAPGGVPRVRQKHPRSSPSARAQPMRPFATGRSHRQGLLSSTEAHGLLRGEPVCSSRHIGSRSRALAREKQGLSHRRKALWLAPDFDWSRQKCNIFSAAGTSTMHSRGWLFSLLRPFPLSVARFP